PKKGWQISIEGKPSFEVQVRFADDDDVTYGPEAMVGAAIPMIGEVMKASPGILLPEIFAPFRKRLLTDVYTNR
ncbi:MAG: hypothetical protein HC869_18290, partial [Rhodospirillales bacterium]|nr:hypothetical protein [Rhodospirillales bacterium]